MRMRRIPCYGDLLSFPGCRGVVQSMYCIVREEGLLALWKGNMVAELLWGCYMSVQFFAYTTLQASMPRMHG